MPSPFVDTRGNLLNCHVHSPIIPRCAHPDTFISAFYMSAELFISSAVVIYRRSFCATLKCCVCHLIVWILQPHRSTSGFFGFFRLTYSILFVWDILNVSAISIYMRFRHEISLCMLVCWTNFTQVTEGMRNLPHI